MDADTTDATLATLTKELRDRGFIRIGPGSFTLYSTFGASRNLSENSYTFLYSSRQTQAILNAVTQPEHESGVGLLLRLHRNYVTSVNTVKESVSFDLGKPELVCLRTYIPGTVVGDGYIPGICTVIEIPTDEFLGNINTHCGLPLIREGSAGTQRKAPEISPAA